MRIHSIGLPVCQLSRIGSSTFDSVFTSWWQFMQVSVGGTIASGARSTFDVAVPAIEPELPRVQAVRVGHRLFRGVPNLREPG